MAIVSGRLLMCDFQGWLSSFPKSRPHDSLGTSRTHGQTPQVLLQYDPHLCCSLFSFPTFPYPT